MLYIALLRPELELSGALPISIYCLFCRSWSMLSCTLLSSLPSMGSIANNKEGPSALINQLNYLAPRLTNEGDDLEARREALQIVKTLKVQLEQPENVAVDLAFSVRLTWFPALCKSS